MSDQLRPSRPHGAGPRRLVAPVGVLAAVLAAFAVVATVDPHEPGHYPVCPLLRYTGLLCPGCGGLRSAHSFAHGDLAAAFGCNALAVLGYVAFAVLWCGWLLRRVGPLRGARRAPRRPPGPAVRLPGRRSTWWALGLLVVVFTLVRNLPHGAALAP